ncbi:MAG: epoxyqueuosine reductase QueH [Eubacterium sp.]|nr:epoxyqueuosine reductase QueH [Eubacterium sp.]
MDRFLAELKDRKEVPKLLLHSCCAPCSSYVLEYLSPFFHIFDFYYNPNISPAEEYRKRVEELKRLIREMPLENPVTFIEGRYDPQEYYSIARGYEDAAEGGERCFRCFELRLREAAREAKKQGADFFATTLTISPLKNAAKLNEIGFMVAEEEGVSYLPSDFKKKNGYKRSTELSGEYGLYRQNFCGCIYSRREAKEREKRQKD